MSAISHVFHSPHRVITVGESLEPDLPVPDAVLKAISFHVKARRDHPLWFNGGPVDTAEFRLNETAPVAAVPGELSMEMKLFGIIPLRQYVVSVVPRIEVVPGGQSIGVLLHARGVMVVGHSDVYGRDGKRKNPAKEAGIRPGDLILKINGQTVHNDGQVRNRIDELGRRGSSVELEVKRGGKVFRVKIEPVFCPDTKRYRVGIFIRDSAAGVGTLTFYESRTGWYGALGHMVVDVDTMRPLELTEGRIVDAAVQGINPGRRGRPGEKIGLFFDGGQVVGDIRKNTRYGIYGVLNRPLQNGLVSEPVPVALAHQVKEGPAEILTVLRGSRVEKFAIEIQRVIPQAEGSGKGLVIRVTDPELIARTGGIIQGMSGSPILQDGKFVGAVTHVFVNDPTRGYGVLGEWMLREAGLISGRKVS